MRHGDKEFCRRRTRGDKAAAGKLVNTLRGDKTVAGKLVNTSVNTSAAPREAKVVDDVPPSLGDGKDMGKLRIEDGMNVCSCSLSCVGGSLSSCLRSCSCSGSILFADRLVNDGAEEESEDVCSEVEVQVAPAHISSLISSALLYLQSRSSHISHDSFVPFAS